MLKVSIVPERVRYWEGGDFCRFDFEPRTLPSWVKSGSAIFGNLGTVELKRLDDSLIGRSIPARGEPGIENVTVKADSGDPLGRTVIEYYDELEEMMDLVVKNPSLHAPFFFKMGLQAQANCSDAQNSAGSGSTQPFETLKLAVCVAAKCGAMQFIKTVFSSKTGRAICKENPLLPPQLIAREHGYEEIANYLKELTTRFSKEAKNFAEESQEIDWQELTTLAEAAIEKEERNISSEERTQQDESDSFDTGYLGDSETSSSEMSPPPNSQSDDSEDDFGEAFCETAKADERQPATELKEKFNVSSKLLPVETVMEIKRGWKACCDQVTKESPKSLSDCNLATDGEISPPVEKEMSTDRPSDLIKLLDDTTVVWKREAMDMGFLGQCVAFSRLEQFLVVGTPGGMLVLNAETGSTLLTLPPFSCVNHCAFISDDDCVIFNSDLTVHLLNVKSGELLSAIDVEGTVTCLAACPLRRLLAIGLQNSSPNFKVFKVHSSRFEDIRNRKRITSKLKEKEEQQTNPKADVQEISSYSGASNPGPTMSAPNMFRVISRLPTILSTAEFPGDMGFQISFGPLPESASKSATWTYSHVCKKLYVNLASYCPIKFKTNLPPPHGTVLRAVAVFKGSTNLHDVVKRCSNHIESSNDGPTPKDPFIRSNNLAAQYHTCPETMRDSVVMPYNGPQVGTEYVTEMFAFMCLSSFDFGLSKRSVEVIFTLEKDGKTLGRRVVEIRVCACPGRDRKYDERTACGEPSSSQAVRMRRWIGSGNTRLVAKRRRTNSRNSTDEEFVLPSRSRHVYDLLLDFKEKQEDKFESLNIDNLVVSTSEDEGEQPLTSGRDEVKGVTTSPSELPTSSSPQPSYSNPPAYPCNIGHTSYSPSITFGNRNATISSITTSHSENVSSYSEALTPDPSMSPPNMFGLVSRLPTIPSTTEYPGDIGFQISFGPLTESASKSATWTYSDVCKKLYVNLASFCPIKFKTNMPPPHATVLRAVAVFKGSMNLHDVVKRCPNHMESSNDGSAPKDEFILSENPAAHYHTCPETLRHSVVLPYNGPQVGTEYVTEMFAFMCFSSCASGPGRRPVEAIFTLEKDGKILGRRVVEIKVCACPGRDRKYDERTACGEPSSFQAVGMRRCRKGSGSTRPVAKRRRTNSRNSTDEEFVITTRSRHVCQLLLDFKEELADRLKSLDKVVRTSEDEGEQPLTSGRDEVKGVTTSPSELPTSSSPQPSYSKCNHILHHYQSF